MKKIRWGIISTGRIADWFVRDFHLVADAELAAVASRSDTTAREFASRHGIPRAYGSYEALFEDPGIDVIYLGTPHTSHLGNATAALKAGKAVLCEKPLTINPAECERLIARAIAADRYLMEAMWTFFLPAIRRAQEWVAQGRIGRLRHVKADFGYPLVFDPQRREYNPSLGGGALLEMGIYPVALAWLFIKRDPVNIRAVVHHALNGVEDEAEFIFDYGDATATLGTSFRCKLPNVAYLIGEEGYIAIPDFWRARECSLYRLDECIDRFADGRRSQGFEYEAAAVTRDLLAGRRQSETIPLAHSLKFQQHLARVRNARDVATVSRLSL